MSAPTVPVDWARAQEALRAEVARATQLMRSGLDPDAPAVGEWTVAAVAMHLSQAWMVVPGLAQEDLSAVYAGIPPIDEVAGRALIRDVWDLADVTRLGVAADTERDLTVLADRIEARAAAYFAAITGKADDLRGWIVDATTVPLATLTCHLLNESIVHPWDMANACRRPWPIDRAHAAMVIEGFILPEFQRLGPRAMVDQERAAGVRARFELRIRGGNRYVFAFDHGALSIEGPLTSRARKIDCHLSVDPAAMLLVAWGRRSQWPAIASGKLVAWGRKPWLGPRFRALLRNP